MTTLINDYIHMTEVEFILAHPVAVLSVAVAVLAPAILIRCLK